MNNHDQTFDATNGGVEAVADLAVAAADLAALADDGTVVGGVYPHGFRQITIDLEQYEPAPRRKTGQAVFDDSESFVHYVERQAIPIGEIGFYTTGTTVTAVFDDHFDRGPGWRQFTAVYRATPTPEWKAWDSINKVHMRATALADFVEEWRHTIAEPATADIIDLVRSFRATRTVTFRDEHIDRSGDRSLEYVSETQATGGAKGTLDVPESFTLAVAPFEGAELIPVVARFRYRLDDDGTAAFGVVIEQADKLARDTFDALVDDISDELGVVTIMRGRPA